MDIIKQDTEWIIIACILMDVGNEYVSVDMIDRGLFSLSIVPILDRAIVWRKEGKNFDWFVFSNGDKNIIQKLLKAENNISHISNYTEYYKLLQRFVEQEKFNQIYHEFSLTGKIDKEKLLEFSNNEPGYNLDDNILSGSSVEIGKYQEFFKQRSEGKIKTYQLYMPELDYTIGKIYPGSSITIGARSSKGKSALLLQVFYDQIKNGIPSLYISSEMGSRSLIDRIISRVTGIDYYNIRNGTTTDSENETIMRETDKLKSYPFYFYISSRFDVSKIEKLVKQTKAEFVFLDYIQRFQLPGKYDSRASAFSDIANDLKSIALNNNIICISASQLNKADEVKESMGIYEAADIIIYIKDVGEDEGKTKTVNLVVDKNRDGRTATLNYIFEKYRGYFKFLGLLERRPEPIKNYQDKD